jgi:hypothetical protein
MVVDQDSVPTYQRNPIGNRHSPEFLSAHGGKEDKDGIKFLVLTQNPFLVTWCLGGETGFC